MELTADWLLSTALWLLLLSVQGKSVLITKVNILCDVHKIVKTKCILISQL